MSYTKVRQILEQIKNIKRIQRKGRCANIFKKNSYKRDTYGGQSSLDEVGTLQSNNLNADMLKWRKGIKPKSTDKKIVTETFENVKTILKLREIILNIFQINVFLSQLLN